MLGTVIEPGNGKRTLTGLEQVWLAIEPEGRLWSGALRMTIDRRIGRGLADAAARAAERVEQRLGYFFVGVSGLQVRSR